MKRDPKLVINGYNVPSGFSRIAVAAAVDLIKRNPGASQVDVLKHAVRFSGLNDSTAGWITTPGPKSPANILWNRRKEGVFRCYPNEHTAHFTLDPLDLASDLCKRAMEEQVRFKVGDLVQICTYDSVFDTGMIISFGLLGTWEFNQAHKDLRFTDPAFLDDPAIYGLGVPVVHCEVMTSKGLVTWSPTQLRAMPAGA